MIDQRHLALVRQQLIEMPTPPGRVLALAICPRGCPIQDAFDPTAYPACRLCLARPNWLDSAHDQPHVNRLNGQRTEDRIDILAEGRRPLRGVLRIAPACPMARDVLLGALLERHCDHALGMARRQWINPIKHLLPTFACLLASFSEGD